MSDLPPETAGPFDLPPLGPEAELDRLARVLHLADGFTLLFARCNPPAERRRLMAELRVRCPAFAPQEIHLDRPVVLLLDELASGSDGAPPDAVFVSGLEHSVSAAAPEAAARFLASLDASRNAFPTEVPCPLVLWVPEHVLLAIATEAPAFYSVRSGTFSLDPPVPASLPPSEPTLDYATWVDASLPVDEKRERVASLRALLAEYEALPPPQRDRRVEASIMNRLGALWLSLGDIAEADHSLRGSLHIARGLSDRAGEATALGNLAKAQYERGDCDQAQTYLEQSLKIQRELGDRAGEGTTLNNLSQIYSARGDYDQALTYLEQSLKIQRELGDRTGMIPTLHNMAHIHLQKKDTKGAVERFAEAWQAAQETGDAQGMYNVGRDCGRLLCRVGDAETGLELLRASVKVGRQMGAPDVDRVEALLAECEAEAEA